MARHSQRWKLPVAVYLLLATGLIHASNHFPTLSGRVVDNANMLDQAGEQRLTALLEGHQNATSNQLVIVTLPDLGGVDIETYGYQLGRSWGIGQKGKDNGLLLIVAKKERKIRIEVGYGLEGSLTDAISSNIINSVILPEFKKGQFGNGIEQGATAIIQALGGQYKMKKGRGGSANKDLDNFKIVFIIFIFIFIAFNFFSNGRRSRRGGYYGSGSGGGFSGGGGGGFSGGGGSFGGGGASGGW